MLGKRGSEKTLLILKNFCPISGQENYVWQMAGAEMRRKAFFDARIKAAGLSGWNRDSIFVKL